MFSYCEGQIGSFQKENVIGFVKGLLMHQMAENIKILNAIHVCVDNLKRSLVLRVQHTHKKTKQNKQKTNKQNATIALYN